MQKNTATEFKNKWAKTWDRHLQNELSTWLRVRVLTNNFQRTVKL